MTASICRTESKRDTNYFLSLAVSLSYHTPRWSAVPIIRCDYSERDGTTWFHISSLTETSNTYNISRYFFFLLTRLMHKWICVYLLTRWRSSGLSRFFSLLLLPFPFISFLSFSSSISKESCEAISAAENLFTMKQKTAKEKKLPYNFHAASYMMMHCEKRGNFLPRAVFSFDFAFCRLRN